MTTIITIIITIIATIIAIDTTTVNTANVNAADNDGLGDGDVTDDIFVYSVAAGAFNLATATEEEILRRVRPTGAVQTWEFSHGLDFLMPVDMEEGYEDWDDAFQLGMSSGEITEDTPNDKANEIAARIYRDLVAEKQEREEAFINERLQQIAADTDKVICVSLKGEEAGSYGVHVRGEVVLAADTDIYSYVSSNGTRTCDWKKWWPHILLDENANRMMAKESGFHEMWITRFEVTGAWVRSQMPERQKAVVAAFALKGGIPYSEV